MGEPAFVFERMKQRYTCMLDYAEYYDLVRGMGHRSRGFRWRHDQSRLSGGPLTLLSQKVCGIEPTSPGFRTFKISPQLGPFIGSLGQPRDSLWNHPSKHQEERQAIEVRSPNPGRHLRRTDKAKWYPQASRPGAPSSGISDRPLFFCGHTPGGFHNPIG